MKKIRVLSISKKLIIILVLLLLFLLPINLIANILTDREDYQKVAISSITEPLGSNVEINGIYIAIPYKYNDNFANVDGGIINIDKMNYVLFTPDEYDLNFNVDTYYLKRGIFKIPVFNASMDLKLIFEDLVFKNYQENSSNLSFNDARLFFDIPHMKNVVSIPNITTNNGELEIIDAEYNISEPLSDKLCYKINSFNSNNKTEIKGEIELQGASSISISPIGNNNNFSMASNWKTPGFNGGFLPKERNISDKGFEAKWEITRINTNFPKSFILKSNYNFDIVNIDLVKHIDNYALVERCLKYAILFLFVPFLAIFLLELFTKKRIHPIQYILVGSVDVLYYLLLISISEHVNFNITYFICSLSVILPSFLYIVSIFKSLKHGYILAVIQFLLYTLLYVTILSEDYALLIGSISLFILVIALMFITRKIDWYRIDVDFYKGNG